mmetsp:Transcript_20689/g.50995  ORF Transcript_20689/g.50995 Transcript_20689/m.50995 type:complete len:217 (-) Transcript_20689:79-729(-)
MLRRITVAVSLALFSSTRSGSGGGGNAGSAPSPSSGGVDGSGVGGAVRTLPSLIFRPRIRHAHRTALSPGPAVAAKASEGSGDGAVGRSRKISLFAGAPAAVLRSAAMRAGITEEVLKRRRALRGMRVGSWWKWVCRRVRRGGAPAGGIEATRSLEWSRAGRGSEAMREGGRSYVKSSAERARTRASVPRKRPNRGSGGRRRIRAGAVPGMSQKQR